MVIVTPSQSEESFLKIMFGKDLYEDLYIRLYINDYTPNADSVTASFTEVSGFSYVPLLLHSSAWVITASTPSVALYPEQIWTFSGALGTIYGYFVTQTLSGKLMWAERFETSPLPAINGVGDQLHIIPRITLN